MNPETIRPFLPDPLYEVWREDDHGNKALVCICPNEEMANKLVRQYEERHHKQMYWVETKPLTPPQEPAVET